MQVIETRYLPCTNFKPARIVARTTNGKRIIRSQPIDCENSITEQGIVADELRRMLNWPPMQYVGHTFRGAIWAFIPKDDKYTIG